MNSLVQFFVKSSPNIGFSWKTATILSNSRRLKDNEICPLERHFLPSMHCFSNSGYREPVNFYTALLICRILQ